MIRKLSLLLFTLAAPFASSFAADVVGDGNLVVGYGNNNYYVRALHGAGVPGTSSMIFGNSNVTGSYSGAFGYGNTVTTAHAFTLGVYNQVYAQQADSLGSYLRNESYGSVVVGRYNAYVAAWSEGTWEPTDPIFVVGNGNSEATRSNALVVLKNGNATLKGNLEVGTLATPNSAVVRVPQSGDISMGAFN